MNSSEFFAVQEAEMRARSERHSTEVVLANILDELRIIRVVLLAMDKFDPSDLSQAYIDQEASAALRKARETRL